MLQVMEVSGTVGNQFSGALDNFSFGSCSSSLAHDTDEAMSASSWVARVADEAMSESSWTALAKEKERDWWSVDLEGEMKKLEVEGHLSRTEGGSVGPHFTKRVLKCKSLRRKVIHVESEETQDYVRETPCQVPMVNHEEPFTGVTFVAVKRPSDTGM